MLSLFLSNTKLKIESCTPKRVKFNAIWRFTKDT